MTKPSVSLPADWCRSSWQGDLLLGVQSARVVSQSMPLTAKETELPFMRISFRIFRINWR
jgi:hypothetical protein